MKSSQSFPCHLTLDADLLWACHKMAVPVQGNLLRNYVLQKPKEIIFSSAFSFKDKENF